MLRNMFLKGLRNLEYRGYDSWGIGALVTERVCIEKQIGKISEAKLPEDFPKSTIAIGHTRWATHGGVTQKTHIRIVQRIKKVAVVHNGIIENFSELRQELILRGHLLPPIPTLKCSAIFGRIFGRGEDLVLVVRKQQIVVRDDLLLLPFLLKTIVWLAFEMEVHLSLSWKKSRSLFCE